MSGRRLVTAYTALLSLWFASIAPYAYGREDRDVAAALPSTTLGYASWSELIPREGDSMLGALLDAIPAFLQQFGMDEQAAAQSKEAFHMIGIAARGTGAIAFLGLEGDGDGHPRPSLALLIHAGAEAEQLAANLNDIVEKSGTTQETLDRVVFQHARESDGGFYWGSLDEWFIATTTRSAALSVLAALGGSGGSLAQNAQLKTSRERVGAATDVPARFSLFVDAPGVLAMIRQTGDIPPEAGKLIHELGIDALTGMYVRCGETTGGGRFHAWIGADSFDRGLTTLWRQDSLSKEDLLVVPADAYWACATKFDLSGVYQEALRIAGEMDKQAPGQIQGGVAMVASMLGFSPTDDLLPALGDTWVFYDAPDHGGFLFSGAVLVLKPDDPARLGAMFTRIIEVVAPFAKQANFSLESRQVEYEGHTIHYLVAAGAPVGIVPSAALVGDHVIVGLSPQVIEVALRQLDPQTRQGSILDNEQVRVLTENWPENAQTFAFNDAHAGTRALYPLMHGLQLYAASMTAGVSSLDPASLPTLPEAVENARDGVRFCTTADDGILYTSYGSTFTPSLSAGYVAVVALLVSILLPSLSRARQLAKRTVSASDLRNIGIGCQIYASDHGGQFPPNLEELVAAGMLTPEILISPRGRETALSASEYQGLVSSGALKIGAAKAGVLPTSFIYIAGQTTKSNMRNVLAYEKVVGDEGTNVLFVDGHVEFMKFPYFQQTLRQTYERLGREDEIPAEFRE